MNSKNKSYVSLILWILSLILIGSLIGLLTKPEVNSWYLALNRSPLTPPSYVFGVVWTILYAVIGICGWIIWRHRPFPKLELIKYLYIIQLILNWSWSPLFFSFHCVGLALICLLIMNLLVALIIYYSYQKIKLLAWLMGVYLIWLVFAAYLNIYIWQHS